MKNPTDIDLFCAAMEGWMARQQAEGADTLPISEMINAITECRGVVDEVKEDFPKVMGDSDTKIRTMKAYIVTDKRTPEHSHEIRVIVADGLKDLRKIMKNEGIIHKNWELKNFNIEEKKAQGIVYTDIY